MLFSKEALLDIVDAGAGNKYNDLTVVTNPAFVERRRWTITYVQVFSYEGKYYQMTYSEGSTEMQDEKPFEYEGDFIECPEVKPVEKTVLVYERIKLVVPDVGEKLGPDKVNES